MVTNQNQWTPREHPSTTNEQFVPVKQQSRKSPTSISIANIHKLTMNMTLMSNLYTPCCMANLPPAGINTAATSTAHTLTQEGAPCSLVSPYKTMDTEQITRTKPKSRQAHSSHQIYSKLTMSTGKTKYVAHTRHQSECAITSTPQLILQAEHHSTPKGYPTSTLQVLHKISAERMKQRVIYMKGVPVGLLLSFCRNGFEVVFMRLTVCCHYYNCDMIAVINIIEYVWLLSLSVTVMVNYVILILYHMR